MARVGLRAASLDPVHEAPAAPAPAPVPESEPELDSSGESHGDTGTGTVDVREDGPAGGPPKPRPGVIAEAGLQRKETWLSPQQKQQLDELANRLQRGRARKAGPRITANSVIRAAIAHALEVPIPAGVSSEQELLAIFRQH